MNQRDACGSTPLSTAAEEGFPEIVKILVDQRAGAPRAVPFLICALRNGH